MVVLLLFLAFYMGLPHVSRHTEKINPTWLSPRRKTPAICLDPIKKLAWSWPPSVQWLRRAPWALWAAFFAVLFWILWIYIYIYTWIMGLKMMHVFSTLCWDLVVETKWCPDLWKQKSIGSLACFKINPSGLRGQLWKLPIEFRLTWLLEVKAAAQIQSLCFLAWLHEHYANHRHYLYIYIYAIIWCLQTYMDINIYDKHYPSIYNMVFLYVYIHSIYHLCCLQAQRNFLGAHGTV